MAAVNLAIDNIQNSTMFHTQIHIGFIAAGAGAGAGCGEGASVILGLHIYANAGTLGEHGDA